MAKRPKQTEDPSTAPNDPGGESDALLDAAGQFGSPAESAAPVAPAPTPTAASAEHPAVLKLREEIAAHEAELETIGDPYAEVTELNRRHDAAKQRLDEAASKLQADVDSLFIELRNLRETQIPIIQRMNDLKHLIAKKRDQLYTLTAK